jgi:hypothetical protein
LLNFFGVPMILYCTLVKSGANPVHEKTVAKISFCSLNQVWPESLSGLVDTFYASDI